MPAHIVDARPEYAPPPFAKPPASGYVYLAASVEPPRERAPIPRGGARKDALLGRLKVLAAELKRQELVRRADVFRAVMVPPDRHGHYDVSVLLETDSPDDLGALRACEPYRRMAEEVRGSAREVQEMPARCLRFLGDANAKDDGLFLFNHFTAEDPGTATRVWEHLAGWYVTELGLDNSCLIAPLDPSEYAFVNYARWDMSLAEFAFKQYSRKSFRSYVRGNIAANGMTATPILYHKA
jgi:hypothetical protein